MYRTIVCLLGTSVVLAQIPRREPFDAMIQAYWTAHNSGRFDEAAAQRDEARRLLERMPVEAPQFGGWANNLARLYENGGMSAQARSVIEDSLFRAAGLGTSHPARVMLLNALADSWEQDRNLLKSLKYRLRAIAALEAGHEMPNQLYAYQRLANTYRQLGRREELDAVTAKILASHKDNDPALASFYEQEGQLDEAAAVYQRQAGQWGAKPQQVAAALGSLASLYQRQERYNDAAAALGQAIGNIEASGRTEERIQSMWLRQRLAGILNQAGQVQAADGIYTQLLADAQTGPNLLQFLTSYANHLAATQRGAQAESLLNNYLASHSNLKPWEESSVLSSLANAARASGQTQRAGEYERAAAEKRQAAASPGQASISEDFQQARSAANRDDIDEALRLGLQAMDRAGRAADRDQITWQVPSLADTLANRKAPEGAELLYQRLLGLVESWSADNLNPLLAVQQRYTRFLMQQGRWAELPSAIDRYRSTLITAHGAGTGRLGDVLHLTIDSARVRRLPAEGLAAAQEALALEESLNGATSEPYLRAVEALAEVLEWNGDFEHALSLRRQAVTIADLVYRANDVRRGYARIAAASTLAYLRQFDEAEQLAGEAVALAQSLRPPQPNPFTAQLEQIRNMKNVATQTTGSSRWFRKGSFGFSR